MTQVVGLLHHELNWIGVMQAVLVFWLVWWAWTQFTWALNAADTTHHLVELGTLVATAVAFFMAVALPDAFHGRALWFAIPYVLVRVIGLALYAKEQETNWKEANFNLKAVAIWLPCAIIDPSLQRRGPVESTTETAG